MVSVQLHPSNGGGGERMRNRDPPKGEREGLWGEKRGLV